MARRGRAFSTTSIIDLRGIYQPAQNVDTDVVLLTLTPSVTETYTGMGSSDITIIKQAVNRASTY